MKIQAHELGMNSEHTKYKSIIEDKLSFSTFFSYDNIEETPQKPPLKTEPISDRFGFFGTNGINEIIKNLISMLQKRVQGAAPEQESEKMGMTHISYYSKFEECESLDFSTKGCVKTDKGNFDIDLNFSMSRSFVIENRIDIYSAFDPLVINLEGDIPDLSQETFSFDLDNDGEADQISKLKRGNGFLALDKNGDGVVNQGSELFGTKTGDGFGELAEYDLDGNNWIDENDSIFNKLQIWLKNDESSEKELVGLGEAGIGAIYLNSTSSEFSYKTEFNQTLGEMKSCGMFLNENGSCGNVSQIDFSLNKEPENLAKLLQA